VQSIWHEQSSYIISTSSVKEPPAMAHWRSDAPQPYSIQSSWSRHLGSAANELCRLTTPAMLRRRRDINLEKITGLSLAARRTLFTPLGPLRPHQCPERAIVFGNVDVRPDNPALDCTFSRIINPTRFILSSLAHTGFPRCEDKVWASSHTTEAQRDAIVCRQVQQR
jgi:hypothetical protein